ncbi:winged helix DNA-binding protein [Oceanicola sp. S124]|uniref:winged helix DNA-binding protein n=1 Tax=Oceanicola sp. S124 TaxID=1042378 RepID=UPI0002557D48|nr:winged helix DNA-binding protein [Oceanicola sp. S124]
MSDSRPDGRPDGRRIVSSRHLAEGEGWEASEFEYGLIIAYNAFTRWMQRCMTAAGMPELSPLEILVLHNTNSRGREKRLTDICFILNIEDSHTVNYALRKLLKLGLLDNEKRGKEVFYKTSPAGLALCMAYQKIREQCLLGTLPATGYDGEELRRIASALRGMSGLYDQASRAAASL